MILYNKYRLLLVLCRPYLKYVFHQLILKSQDTFLNHISNRNGEEHYMLQVIKLCCNSKLIGYLYSNGSMKSAQLAAFFFGLGCTLMSLCCCKNKQQKKFKKSEIIFFCIFEKSQNSKLITPIGCVSE